MGDIKHSGFLASHGTNGWYTTTVENEKIEFGTQVNSLFVESFDTDLAIKINNFNDLWYIDAGSSDGLENMVITSITVMGLAGTKIRWKALHN